MATAAHPEDRKAPLETTTAWDGRARCRLCASNAGTDHDWCAIAGALVCDACCEEILSGEPARLQAVLDKGARTMAPIEILASCAACPRLERMLVDDEDDESSASDETGVLH